MTLDFYKYQGTGNDFVILDNRDNSYDNLTRAQVADICDRRFGIGADGLMMLNNHPDHDFQMIYFNADGRESSMCGNGGRCLVQFASDIGLIRTNYDFLAIDGPHQASINTDGTIALKMNNVDSVEMSHGNYILNTGSPHCVVPSSDVMHLDVVRKGREIRYSDDYREEGINVNFIEQMEEPDKIIVRTYERGVEDETFSCGTGVTAAALVSFHNDNGFNRVEVKTKGGRLSVEFERTNGHYRNIWLIGAAQFVFKGSIEIK